MPKPTKTDLELIVWGATGFTGRLVAEHLARTQDAHRARWALAGRDRDKLEQIRGSLASLHPSCAELPILLGDARDAASLDALVARTRVILTAVGPYSRYGSALVAACARSGTDYCDLTGEVHWMRKMIDAHHAEARESGARIVHTCGFDSIPSDLGVLMLQEHMREQHGSRCDRVRLYVTKMRGGFSGGTVASALQTMDDVQADPSLRQVLGDPHALDPEPGRSRLEEKDQLGVRYNEELGQWTGPFMMSAVNTRVVRRSNALLGHPWGRDFLYSEVSAYGPGPRGLLTAGIVTAGLGSFLVLSSVPVLRRQLERRVLPAPGEGPSAEERERGHFEMKLVGEGTSARTGRPATLTGKVSGSGDPGYAATARMLSEAALCLAFDDLPAEGGVLTPATSMGMRLVERLRRGGMTFEVEERTASPLWSLGDRR
ncbi:MAG TPA: saccharopine dehydrogenase NADP-binding domain-containing protein [Polyangiaceae bacterium]|nr:saccharopine dehydrogenase NADP-binding domain-containing protein [Polyangiaceae bacterium]